MKLPFGGSSLEGSLEITLRVTGTEVRRSHLKSSRPVPLGKLFEGQTEAVIQETLPLIFAICGEAQGQASALALAEASQRPLSEEERSSWNRRTHWETLREHLFRILASWPSLMGEEPLREALREFAKIGRLGDSSKARPPAPHRESSMRLEALCLLMERWVLGEALDRWQQRQTWAELQSWMDCRKTVAARLLATLGLEGPEFPEPPEPAFLPPWSAKAVHQRLDGEDSVNFAREPTWQGTPRETGPLARQKDHPAIQAWVSERGWGPGVRLLARLIELSQLVLEPHRGDVGALELEPEGGSKSGLGVVETARGRLIHRVVLDSCHRAVRYQIVAPTEWNFHPQGSLLEELASLRGDSDSIHRQARLRIEALDPCVRYQLKVIDDA